MPSKRASSRATVTPAFGRPARDDEVVHEDRHSRADEADPAAQDAALDYARKLEADAMACGWCSGEWDQSDHRLIHSRECPRR